ncbi:hypothetical protein [uncultured Maritimibacter sp.]|jgi:hypothetical protein|uniref:hypothetical protein n=1 Tax=uncultured Maritimibacter sp. TaxID=991866 RepID=UPI000B333FC2|nr:hypothetical protein [uncultured Maritimibacter sp.]
MTTRPTLADLERARDQLADMILAGNRVAARPIYERLCREIEAAKEDRGFLEQLREAYLTGRRNDKNHACRNTPSP